MADSVTNNQVVSAPVLQKWVDHTNNRMQSIDMNVLRLQHLHHKITDTVNTLVTETGIPSFPTSCSISVAGVILNGQVWQELTATYTSPNPVDNFAGVFIVLKNYRGSVQLVKQAEDTFIGPGNTSKSFKFRLEKTGETVTFYFVPKNGQEGTVPDWTAAPHVAVALTVAAGAVTSTLPTNANSGTNVNGVLLTANPLSNTGTNTVINVAAFTFQFGFGQVSYNSGSVDPGVIGTYVVYFDDPIYAGGTVTFHATATRNPLTAAEGRFILGVITTTAGGTSSGDGDGSGTFTGGVGGHQIPQS